MTYQDEQNAAFEYLLNGAMSKPLNLELIVTPECKLNCAYCYLQKNKDKLYPKEIRGHEEILNNLHRLFEYVKENHLKFPTIEIFSGELLDTDFGYDFLYELKNILVSFDYPVTKQIVIPSNFSFIGTEYEEVIEWLIDVFREDLDIEIILSCSVDGKYLDSNRVNHDDEWYDKMFKFIKQFNCGIHPMLSAIGIEKWKDNYLWWIDNIIKHDIKFSNGAYKLPMILEVRDNNWTLEAIMQYEKLLHWIMYVNHILIDKEDITKTALRVFDIDYKDNLYKGKLYDVIGFPKVRSSMSCGIQDRIHVRLGDLSIVPCHRTMYPEMVYGSLENGKLVSNNLALAVSIYSMNPNVSHIKCSDCKIKYICMKGCLGSQLESNNEIFSPCESVCNLLFAKYKTLDSIFEKYNLYEIALNHSTESEVKRIKQVKGILGGCYKS